MHIGSDPQHDFELLDQHNARTGLDDPVARGELQSLHTGLRARPILVVGGSTIYELKLTALEESETDMTLVQPDTGITRAVSGSEGMQLAVDSAHAMHQMVDEFDRYTAAQISASMSVPVPGLQHKNESAKRSNSCNVRVCKEVEYMTKKKCAVM